MIASLWATIMEGSEEDITLLSRRIQKWNNGSSLMTAEFQASIKNKSLQMLPMSSFTEKETDMKTQ